MRKISLIKKKNSFRRENNTMVYLFQIKENRSTYFCFFWYLNLLKIILCGLFLIADFCFVKVLAQWTLHPIVNKM